MTTQPPYYSSLIGATLDVEAFRRAIGLHGPGDGLEQLRTAWPLSPDRIRWAYRVAGVRLVDSQALEAAVLFGEQLATVANRTDASIETISQVDVLFEAAVSVLDAEPGLIVDGDLGSRLPLLDLAADIAHLQPGGRLVVSSGRPQGCRGIYSRSSRLGVIVLDSSLEGQDLADVFGHELAHAVDPNHGEVDEPALEAFAYALGPVIANRRPASLAELSPLIAATLDSIRPNRRPRSACTDLDALVRWVAVEVGALSETPQFIAADRTWHPSRGRDVKSPPAVQEALTDCDKDGQQGP